MHEAQAAAGAVSIRQLARQTSAVIDWVRERDKPMLITRNGVPVAMIQSLEFDSWHSAAKPQTVLPPMESEIDWEALDLSDREKRVLPVLKEIFDLEDISDDAGLSGGQAAVSCAYLETKRLAKKTIVGYRLTKLGRQVQRALLSDQQDPEES